MSPDDPLLMTPGPTRIPERVLQAGMRSLHHRTPEFSALLAELLERLRPLFGTVSADVLPIHATGRAAMEGAVCNFLNPGDTILSCCNGKFGAMWADLAESYGVQVVRVATDWDRSVDPEDVAQALRRYPGARVVTVAYSDTSTGVLNPVPEIAAAANAQGSSVWVDAISALGGCPFRMDEWGVSLAVTSSQKCLMSSPGMSFVAIAPDAWAAADRATLPRNYWDFSAARDALEGERPETPGTTPVTLVLQVLEATRMLHEEGLEEAFRRHERMARTVREQACALGLSLLGAEIRDRSPSLTALHLPADLRPTDVREALRGRGILVATGLGPHRPTGLRIGHMGDIRMSDVRRTLSALSAVLDEARAA